MTRHELETILTELFMQEDKTFVPLRVQVGMDISGSDDRYHVQYLARRGMNAKVMRTDVRSEFNGSEAEFLTSLAVKYLTEAFEKEA